MSLYQQYFSGRVLVALPVLTMILFVAVFAAVTIRALLAAPSREVSRLPLEALEEEKGIDHV